MYRFNDVEHIHTWNGEYLYGVSTVTGIIGKGSALSWWASSKSCEAMGWIHPKPKVNGKYVVTPASKRIETAEPFFEQIKNGNITDYLGMLDKAYKNHSVKLKDSASEGIDLHAELERYINDVMKDDLKNDYSERIKCFISWCNENVERFLFSEAHCYDSRPEIWCGGIADAGAIMKDGSFAIIDFKSAKEAYFSHFVQAGGGYTTLIEQNGLFTAEGEHTGTISKFDKCYIVPFGAQEVMPVANKINIDVLKECFKCCVILNKEKNSFEKGGD